MLDQRVKAVALREVFDAIKRQPLFTKTALRNSLEATGCAPCIKPCTKDGVENTLWGPKNEKNRRSSLGRQKIGRKTGAEAPPRDFLVKIRGNINPKALVVEKPIYSALKGAFSVEGCGSSFDKFALKNVVVHGMVATPNPCAMDARKRGKVKP